MLCNRFVHLLSGPALTLHQSVNGANGLEVWRLLKKRCDPKTTLRNLQLKIKNPGKVKESKDFFIQVNRWEGWVNMLKRDYGQEVAETAKVGLLILMARDELQRTVLGRADRLRECRQIKEKMVMLLDARGQLKDPTTATAAREEERKKGQKLRCEGDEGSREVRVRVLVVRVTTRERGKRVNGVRTLWEAWP